MIDTEHLDRVERFARWLEQQRKQAGFTQKELAQRAEMSHSYYSKVINIGHLRRTYGDGSREVNAPRSLATFEGALTALEERLGGACREEGMDVWSSLDPEEGTRLASTLKTTSNIPDADRSKLLTDTLASLMRLAPERLALVRDLIDQLR